MVRWENDKVSLAIRRLSAYSRPYHLRAWTGVSYASISAVDHYEGP